MATGVSLQRLNLASSPPSLPLTPEGPKPSESWSSSGVGPESWVPEWVGRTGPIGRPRPPLCPSVPVRVTLIHSPRAIESGPHPRHPERSRADDASILKPQPSSSSFLCEILDVAPPSSCPFTGAYSGTGELLRRVLRTDRTVNYIPEFAVEDS